MKVIIKIRTLTVSKEESCKRVSETLRCLKCDDSSRNECLRDKNKRCIQISQIKLHFNNSKKGNMIPRIIREIISDEQEQA